MEKQLIDILSLDLPAFVVGIGFHEFCHAFAADRLGDPTPRQNGRVSLNPIEHLDPLGTFLPLYLSLVGSPMAFGWGKPVEVNPNNFKDPVKGYGIVAFAGPLGNLLVAALIGLFLSISPGNEMLLKAMTTPTGNFFYRLLFRVFGMNLGLFLFNLLPIPPLDGSKVLMWLGGPSVKTKIEAIQPYSLFILILFISAKLDVKLLVPLYVKMTFILTGPMAGYIFDPGQFVANFL